MRWLMIPLMLLLMMACEKPFKTEIYSTTATAKKVWFSPEDSGIQIVPMVQSGPGGQTTIINQLIPYHYDAYWGVVLEGEFGSEEIHYKGDPGFKEGAEVRVSCKREFYKSRTEVKYNGVE